MEKIIQITEGVFAEEISWKGHQPHIKETTDREKALAVKEKWLNVFLAKPEKTRKEAILSKYPGVSFIEKEQTSKENPLVKALMDYTYKDDKINEHIRIYKRTKKERIKNKKFAQIFAGAVKERGKIHFDELVLMDFEIFDEMKRTIAELEGNIEKVQKKNKLKEGKRVE